MASGWTIGYLGYDPEEDQYYIQSIADGDGLGEGYEVEKESIGQYTGVKDENGKEIYEGDIVNMHYFYEDHNRDTLGVFENETEVVGRAVIENSTVYTVHRGEWYSWTECLQAPEDELEVVGNVYDNPELLEEES